MWCKKSLESVPEGGIVSGQQQSEDLDLSDCDERGLQSSPLVFPASAAGDRVGPPTKAAPVCAHHLADPGRSPFEQAADRETHMLVEAALEKLNPKFRDGGGFGDIEDLSYEDIAAVLDISLGTVKSRILRGREALRKVLEGRLEPQTSVHWSAQLQVD